MRPFIVVGDSAANGAAVILGAASASIWGQRIDWQGERIGCAGHRHRHLGASTSRSGGLTTLLEGKPAVRHGDAAAYGTTLVAGRETTHFA